MTTSLLAIDVGGSTSRATLVDHEGKCLGHGRDGGGNPGSNRPDLAASAIMAAAKAAVADAGLRSPRIELALIAMAGPRIHVAQARLEEGLAGLGLDGPLLFTGDVQAILASVTAATSGYCIVCGTGSGAARLRNGEIEAVVDAAGWLLGDNGSGHWLGHQAARAVTADLEGRGDKTALTGAILRALKIPLSDERAPGGRPRALRLLIDAIYAMRPIELARFAPLVTANRSDPVAARLLADAERYLLEDFRLVFDPGMPAPVALGGGVVGHLTGLRTALRDLMGAAGHSPDIRLVRDGSVGAVVLALRSANIPVDEGMVGRISSSLADHGSAVGP